VSADSVGGWHLSDQAPFRAGTLDAHCEAIHSKEYARARGERIARIAGPRRLGGAIRSIFGLGTAADPIGICCIA